MEMKIHKIGLRVLCVSNYDCRYTTYNRDIVTRLPMAVSVEACEALIPLSARSCGTLIDGTNAIVAIGKGSG